MLVDLDLMNNVSRMIGLVANQLNLVKWVDKILMQMARRNAKRPSIALLAMSMVTYHQSVES